jgi:hypothetical protein
VKHIVRASTTAETQHIILGEVGCWPIAPVVAVAAAAFALNACDEDKAEDKASSSKASNVCQPEQQAKVYSKTTHRCWAEFIMCQYACTLYTVSPTPTPWLSQGRGVRFKCTHCFTHGSTKDRVHRLQIADVCCIAVVAVSLPCATAPPASNSAPAETETLLVLAPGFTVGPKDFQNLGDAVQVGA